MRTNGMTVRRPVPGSKVSVSRLPFAIGKISRGLERTRAELQIIVGRRQVSGNQRVADQRDADAEDGQHGKGQRPAGPRPARASDCDYSIAACSASVQACIDP